MLCIYLYYFFYLLRGGSRVNQCGIEPKEINNVDAAFDLETCALKPQYNGYPKLRTGTHHGFAAKIGGVEASDRAGL